MKCKKLDFPAFYLSGFECICADKKSLLGMYYESSRPDRDDFIEVVWANITSGAEFLFEKISGDNPLGNIPYDYYSIMHPPVNAWGINGSNTLVPKQDLDQSGDSCKTIGQWCGMSDSDVDKVNALYSCPAQEDTDCR